MAIVSKKVAQETRARHGHRLWPKIVIATVFILAVRIIAAQTAAPEITVADDTDKQGYKYQVPHEKLRKSRTDEQKIRGQVRGILNGAPISDPATRQLFRGFYLSYLYPLMTTEEGQKTIGKERADLLRDLQNAKNQEARREVVDFTLPAMKKIVQDNQYRPAARYNAMLIISSLNDVEPNNIGSSPTLPEPMKAALPFILEQFQKADRDEIKLAALLGLSRHLEFDNYKQPPSTPIPPAGRAAIIKELVSLAEAKESPAHRQPDVHLWMRRRAIEALGMACLTKPDADITAAMERLLRDEAEPTSLRLAVASTLGKMPLQAAKIDAVATAKELGYVALKACDAELTRAEKHRKAELEHEARLAGNYQGELEGTGGPGGGFPGGPGRMGGMGGEGGPGGAGVRPLRPAPGMMGAGGIDGGYGSGLGGEMGGVIDPSMLDPRHFQVDYLRRRLRQSLWSVQLGLTGGEDHPPSKSQTPANPAAPAPPAPATTPAPSAGPAADAKGTRGVFSAGKTPQEKKQVDEVYYAVRKLAETVESAGAEAEFNQLLTDMRRDLKPLELVVGKRVVPTDAATETDDEPTSGPAKAGPPGKARPAVPAAKTTTRTTPKPKPQPQVFSKPRSAK
jgi:hypothetical protein